MHPSTLHPVGHHHPCSSECQAENCQSCTSDDATRCYDFLCAPGFFFNDTTWQCEACGLAECASCNDDPLQVCPHPGRACDVPAWLAAPLHLVQGACCRHRTRPTFALLLLTPCGRTSVHARMQCDEAYSSFGCMPKYWWDYPNRICTPCQDPGCEFCIGLVWLGLTWLWGVVVGQ